MTEVHTKLGNLLKGERERRKLTLADLSHDLKIAERHLQAIEDGDLASLPGPLYFGLFAKSYAEALGIDYARSLSAIKEDLGEPIDSPLEESSDAIAPAAPPTGSHTAKTQSTPAPTKKDNGMPRRRSIVSVVIIAILLVALVAVGWVVLKKDGKFSLRSTTPTENNLGSDSDKADGAGSDWSEDYGKTGKKGEKAALNLQMIAHDRTWAVVLADGDTALQTNLKPWREYNIGAQEKLTVSVGTPLAVEMTINGLPVDLSDPDKGNVSSVIVTPENVSMFVRQTPPVDSGSLDSISGDSASTQDSLRPKVTSPKDTVTLRDAAHPNPQAPRDSIHRRDSTAAKSPTSKSGGRNGT